MNDTINGLPIIATWFMPKRSPNRAGRIIIVDRGTEHEERYVVAWQGANKEGGKLWDSSWIESCYCCDLHEAFRAFAKRVEREVA